MKVVMVGPYPEPGQAISGGVARVIDTLLPELAGQVDLTLIVPGAKADAETTSRGVRTIYLKRGPGPGALAYWTADAHRLARLVESERPDLLHLQGSAGVARTINLPKILTVHGIAHRDVLFSTRGRRWGRLARHSASLLMRLVEERARRQIGNTIVINPYVTDVLSDVLMHRRFAIPNPIDVRFCEARPEPQQCRRRTIISVGRVGPLKNTAAIIQIADWILARDQDASTIMCGETTDENYLQDCIGLGQVSGNGDRIKWIGNVGTEELCHQLDSAAVLLMTSQQENAPMAIAEAHARGVAVVAPEKFGIKYMIEPGFNGFFLPDGGVKEQAAVVRAALDHPWDRKAIATRARATYAPDRVARETVAAYRATLADSPR